MYRNLDQLRKEALRQVQARFAADRPPGAESATLHELQVHQIELEMQNRELREAQAELEVSRARYADLYDFAPIPYVTFDIQGRITAINLNGAAMLGHDRANVIGQPFSSAVSLEDPSGFFAHVKACVTRRERVTTELRFTRRRDVVSFAVRVISTPSMDAGGGDAFSVSSALIDVTEQLVVEKARAAALERELAARQALEHANRAKDDFLSVASHELRTPLSAILGWAYLIAKTPGLPAQVRRGTEVILRNAKSQVRLIEDVLDIARLARGALRLDFADVSVLGVAQAAIESVQPAADAKRITLVLDAPEDAHVWGDADRLQQILWNLLTNAVKFSPVGGAVALELGSDEDAVVLRVTDSGCGIAPQHLDLIFDRFRQVDSGPTRQHGGLGLGLTIVKRLVDEHGGEVVAESAGPGSGASFRVTLPRLGGERASELEATRRRSSRPPPLAKPLDSVRLLVVDDDEDSLEMVAEVLETAGALVSRAPSAGAAFEIALREPLTCIVSDLGMPEEDGLTFIRRVRAAKGPVARVPAIALTAYARQEDVDAATSAGFDGHISKPFQPENLIELVVKLLAGGGPRR